MPSAVTDAEGHSQQSMIDRSRHIAALGCRVHSGWAMFVAVSGDPRSPVLIERRRVELVDATCPGSSQPYHAAAELELPEAKSLIDTCARTARDLARRALQDIVKHLDGCEARALGLLVASGRPLPDLETTLRSHAMIHAAEGELFRTAIADATTHLGLPLYKVKEKELMESAAEKLSSTEDDVRSLIKELGRVAGPPWRQDEKYAALAAILALSESAT
jgi:hypothetical protein